MSGNTFEVGKSYSFDIHPTTIIESVFTNVTCTSVLNYDVAKLLFPSLDILHAQIYPYLPAGYPDDPTLYQYAQFRLTTGEMRVLGIPWINIATVKAEQAEKVVVEIKGVTSAQINDIRDALISNGFDQLKITIVTTAGSNVVV